MAINKLGYIVNSLRRALKLTQQDIANAVGCSQGYIADIEKGRVSPSLNTVEKIANALGVNTHMLLMDDIEDIIGITGFPANNIIKEGEAQYHVTPAYLRLAKYAQEKGISAEDVIDVIDFLERVKNRGIQEKINEQKNNIK